MTMTPQIPETPGFSISPAPSGSSAPPAAPAFRELPSGAVLPEGRWRRHLQTIADGWLRRVVQARHGQFYSTFWERNTFSGEFPGDVHSEWAGYVGDALVRISHLLPDSWVAREKATWLEKIIASQDADGYLGAYRPEERWRHGFELWSQDRLLQALLCDYEHSGDRRVLDACARAARRIGEQFQTPEWAGLYARPRNRPGPFQAGHSLNIIHPLIRLSELTGDTVFRDLALSLYVDYDAGAGEYSAARFLATDKIFAHIVTVCEHLSIPAAAHAAGGPRRWLEGALRAFELLCAQSLQVTGILSGNESTYGRGPRKYTEHCGTIEWMISCSRLLALTGEVRFADLAERAMLNAYFGSRSPDGATLAYNHAPNEAIAADSAAPYEDNWDAGMFRAHYSSHHEPRCCNANTSRGFPNYVARAALATAGGGLALVYYGPCRVAARLPGAGEVRLALETDYPYEDTVRIRVEEGGAAAFPLLLRIPGWCRAAEVRVGGARADDARGNPAAPGTFFEISRAWRAGDEVELKLDVPITLDTYTSSWRSVPGVAVVRGPLTFALALTEDWVYCGEGEPGGLKDDWNVLPRAGAAWNVALELDLKNPENSLELLRFSKGLRSGISNLKSDVSIPLGLRGRCRLLPQWKMDTIDGQPQTPALPPPPLRPEGEALDVMLVPFGFTHIRMTYLPVLGLEQTRTVLYNQGKATG